MLSRLSPLLRAVPPPPPSPMAARVLSLDLPYVVTLPSKRPPSPHPQCFYINTSCFETASFVGRRRFNGTNSSCLASQFWGRNGNVAVAAARREYRKVRSRKVAAVKKSKEKELELSVKICLEEQLPEDPEILDTAINDIGCFDSVELSVLLCNDEFIRKLNKEWRDEDHATDVLSMSQHIPELKLPIVHGLLHLLGFDHELSDEAETEMENEEELILKGLGWKGKGLIHSAYDSGANGSPHIDCSNGREKAVSVFTDQNLATSSVTWMTRRAAIDVLKTANLAGRDGIISEFSPGFSYRDCWSMADKALLYSLKHEIPIIAFSDDRCLTLFEHPLVDTLHTVYHEPKAEVIPSVEQFVAGVEIQKLLLLDTCEGIARTLRPYWAEAAEGRACVVQAVPNMLELVPPGSSKGSGVGVLLDHLGVTPKEVMAIGDGENDVEMLKLASLGVALSNGSEKAKAVADVIGISNDEDGVADAIYRYAF
ncbi:UNVERIFIED_CONTAM: Endoribonuclease YBEY, chloroplastic [Sesamum radiatum]|uniref:Endoribonuclease YBEY, chloroplastic n=1 Tax=Sesamum radiatum TaxID=300843 RepID=A0AAW2KXX6_SESRA